MKIVSLRDHPQHIGQLAEWNHAQWSEWSGTPYEQIVERYETDAAATGILPCTLIALEGNELVGFASLRERDSHDWLPGRGPWICNVYVDAKARGRSVATRLCEALIAYARALGIEALYLAAEMRENSLYHRLGFKHVKTDEHGGMTAHIMRMTLDEG